MSEHQPGIFGRIVRGEIPCHKVYEDDRVLAFLDVGPLSRGHTLIIPKRWSPTLGEMDAEDAAAIGRVLPAIARAVVEATGCEDYNLLQNNGKAAHQEVEWVHFHIIPKPPAPGNTSGKEQGLGIGWPKGTLDAEDAAKLAERIAGRVETA